MKSDEIFDQTFTNFKIRFAKNKTPTGYTFTDNEILFILEMAYLNGVHDRLHKRWPARPAKKKPPSSTDTRRKGSYFGGVGNARKHMKTKIYFFLTKLWDLNIPGTQTILGYLRYEVFWPDLYDWGKSSKAPRNSPQSPYFASGATFMGKSNSSWRPRFWDATEAFMAFSLRLGSYPRLA